MSEEKGMMTLEERHALVEGYLGKTVTIGIDRPIGYVHHKGAKTLVYPINYGYIPEVLGGDGEELDVFLVGVDTPVSSYTGKIIGIVYRADDVEDKLVMAPEGAHFSAEEIAHSVHFQEKYYKSTIRDIEGRTFSYETENGIGKGYWGCGHQACIRDFYRCSEEGKRFQVDVKGVEYTFETMMQIYEKGRDVL